MSFRRRSQACKRRLGGPRAATILRDERRHHRNSQSGGRLSGKSRRQLVRVSEQMKRWSALLEAELATWPAVTWRPMFGMTVAYRKGAVFAALPRTRAFETPRSVAFKLYRETPKIRRMLESDSRIAGKTVRPQ